MKRNKKFLLLDTLTGRLGFWGIMMIVLFGLASILSYSWIEYEQTKENRLHNLNDSVILKAKFVEEWIGSNAADIRIIANDSELLNKSPKRIIEHFQNFKQNKQDFEELHFINLSGNIIASTIKSDTSKLNISDRAYFQTALGGSDAISDVLIGKLKKLPIITFASPVKNEQNKVTGVIVGTVSLDRIDQIIRKYDQDSSGQTYVFEPKGLVVASTLKTSSRLPTEKVMNKSLYKAALVHEKLDSSYQNEHGDAVFGTYKWVNKGRWLLVDELDRKEVIDSLVTNVTFLIILTLLLMILFSVITVSIAKVIEKPIKSLLDGVRIISQGNYSHRIDAASVASSSEFIELCLAYNDMSTKIETSVAMLSESRQKYRSLYTYHPDVTYSFDLDGQFLDINGAIQTILGYNKEEMIGIHFYNLLKEEEHSKGDEMFRKTLFGTPQNEDFYVRHKLGHYIIMNVTTIPIIVNGEIQGIHSIAKDITAQRLAEEQLQKAKKDLEESNLQLQQFAYIASHDLQEPLRMVTSYLQLLERRYKGKLDHAGEEFIGYAVNGAVRMQRLIQDLLLYSRVSKKEYQKQAVDLNTVFQTVTTHLRVLIEEKNAKVEAGKLPTLIGDETQFLQLFQNLIGNSIKFNKKEIPIVQISAEREGNSWKISIKDNGIGIPAEHAERIFAPFQRLHTQEEYSGSGIGLAICRKIVERHGGEIKVESLEGQGSTFFLSF